MCLSCALCAITIARGRNIRGQDTPILNDIVDVLPHQAQCPSLDGWAAGSPYGWQWCLSHCRRGRVEHLPRRHIGDRLRPLARNRPVANTRQTAQKSIQPSFRSSGLIQGKIIFSTMVLKSWSVAWSYICLIRTRFRQSCDTDIIAQWWEQSIQ